MEGLYKKAAELLQQADFVLVCVGAGMSSDSGLPVYNDICNIKAYKDLNITYHDLARPVSLFENKEELELYYGFWINSLRMYQSTKPHEGYEILKKWREERFNKVENQALKKKQVEFLNEKDWFKENSNVASNMFVYSSNVDYHFNRFFPEQEVYNIHGHVFNWQCGKPCDNKSIWNTLSPEQELYKLIENCKVNEESMKLVNNIDEFKCSKCKDNYLMPNVLMFGDLGQYIRNEVEEDRYVAWECAVETLCKESDKKYPFVILELGCGLRVPSIRLEVENVLVDCEKACLIRINMGENECNTVHNQELKDSPRILTIQQKNVDALKEIDHYLSLLQ
ncbi:hypothetical protein ABK040_002379 [Willaertia magna]